MRYHEILIAFQQRQAACPRGGKFYVGFVHHHDVVGVGLQNFLDVLRRQQQPGGGVGVGNHHRFMQAAVGGNVQGKVLPQRDNMLRDMQQITQHRVKAVSYIGKCQRCIGIAEGAQRQQQVFVAAVAAQDVFRLYAPVRRNGGVQVGVGQIRIQPQPRHRLCHRLCHRRGGGIGVFVGVELDKILQFQLFAGHIRFQRRQRFGKIAAHGSSSYVRVLTPRTEWSRSWRGHAGPRARQNRQCGPAPRPAPHGCSR